MAVPETILNHIYESLKDLKDGEVSPRAKELAAYYGVTPKTIYEWAAKMNLRWRKVKSTKGTSAVSRDTALQAGALMAAARRTSNQIPLPACDAKEILDDSGIDTGGVSTARFLTRLREEHASAGDILKPSPHVTLLSDHPNHVWQFDVTNCIQYFLDARKGMGERDEDMELYKNKIVKTAKGIKKELLRYVAVDHCSGAFYLRYFYASGERKEDGAQFLFEAMRPKDERIRKLFGDAAESKIGQYRFHGVPFILVADRGSIVSAKSNQALFDAMRIKLEPHMPGNPRAKGAVEGLMHHINRFEARLKFQRPADLDELNRWALDWCIMVNAVKMMRGIAPRSILWSKITAGQLRLCPDAERFHLLIKEPTIQRKANGARLISVDNRTYQVPDSNAAGNWVQVVRHPYEFPAVEVHFNGFVWLLQPIPEDEYGRATSGVHYGEYKAPKHTEAQMAKTEMEKIASGWGLTWKGAGDKRRAEAPKLGESAPLQIFGHQAEKAGNLEFIAKRGTPLDVKAPEAPANDVIRMDACEVSRSISSRRIPMIEFLAQLKGEIGTISPELNQELRAQYGTGIDMEEAAEVIRSIQDGRWFKQESEAMQVTG